MWPCTAIYSNATQITNACAASFDGEGRWYDGDNVVRHGVYKKHSPGAELKKELDQVIYNTVLNK